jgi:hypothetical protein
MKAPGELYNELDVHRSTSAGGREGSKSSHYERNKSEVKGPTMFLPFTGNAKYCLRALKASMQVMIHLSSMV